MGRRGFGVSELTDLQLWKLLKGREVEAGLGEEAAEQAGPVLHPPEPALGRAVSWMMSRLARLAGDRLRCDQTASAGAAARLDRDQRGQRHSPVAAAGHRDHRG